MPLFSKKTFEDYIVDLKLNGKQLERQAKRCERQQKQEQLKLKKAIEQHNSEGARIFAQNAIRKKNERINFLKLAARLDAVAGKLQSANTVQTISRDFGYLVKAIDSAMSSMDLVKVSQVMSKFEYQFEDLDVRGEVLDSSMASTVATAAPEDQVQALIQQTADEYNLELDDAMTGVPVRNRTATSTKSEENSLEYRFNNLKAP
ncbi:charged multivesicular body protein 1 [Galdieria sulphuraria]|uniref:Charged multivesicular body protein 1 n=1 Tax=Galdieria sulphuraria TaxID=130081 RepID=M2XVX5_GALSU|nr:charged multivesicular body protein 1 [Galdieria sulphuraria]EME27584.1 charged multivesicular body protein 1 [Galdieria sulphuraria]|eukprot:XP_005704104.1 charged multivesicular body protein 1 [Galdieria sulphuraria]